MTRVKKSNKKSIEQYNHKGKKRLNNPPVGLVDPQTDKMNGKKEYAYDPHRDPQLVWAGKAEHTSFEVPTVSLHVHERIDPRTIIEAVRKRNGESANQISLFSSAEENPPLRDAIEFYKHKHNWSNRLLAGDSLLVMNSLLEKEGMAGQVQMIYIDPPYGIKYGSNFQPFVNKRDVKDGKDEDLTQEPEMIKAFRDTWELGVHSYLSYLRDRLLLARELLTESGSVFVQIGEENVHLIRCVLDEVFGRENLCREIAFITTSGFQTKRLSRQNDYLIWYAKNINLLKFRPLFRTKPYGSKDFTVYNKVELPNGTRRVMSDKEIIDFLLLPSGSKIFRVDNLKSQGTGGFDFEYDGKKYHPGAQNTWKTTYEGMLNLAKKKRIILAGSTLGYVRYYNDFPLEEIKNIWTDTITGSFTEDKQYVVQTNSKVIERCLLMTTDPGDLVLDPTCGSGTTAYVAEERGGDGLRAIRLG